MTKVSGMYLEATLEQLKCAEVRVKKQVMDKGLELTHIRKLIHKKPIVVTQADIEAKFGRKVIIK
tara:strand:+ start:1230 stop:1424 length:195 start_codon:yes stop_codon:yes gene_type:complete